MGICSTKTKVGVEDSDKKTEEAVPENKYARKARLNEEWSKLDIEIPPPKKVTLDELAKHATAEDCWTSLHGKVYNITTYLAYHPGSKQQLMKGAGKDCTEMFNKIHSYVQYEIILAKCLIGSLEEYTDL